MMITRIGTILAAAYLTIVFVVSVPFLFDIVVSGGGGRLHSASGMSMVFVMLLTSPLSWPGVSAVDSNFSESTEFVRSVLAACVLMIAALVNAAIIYLFAWTATRLIWGTSERSMPLDD